MLWPSSFLFIFLIPSFDFIALHKSWFKIGEQVNNMVHSNLNWLDIVLLFHWCCAYRIQHPWYCYGCCYWCWTFMCVVQYALQYQIFIIYALMKPIIIFTIKLFNLPDRICIQPQIWKTVVDFRKNKNTKNNMVSTDVTTDRPTKAVATFDRSASWLKL